jgi:putative sterol carrier protein
MPTFNSSEELYEIFVGFMREMAADPVLGPRFRASKTSFRVNYTDPDASILVDCTTDPLDIVERAYDRQAEVDMTMTAEDGHRFWTGQLKIAQALARKKIKVTGKLPKMMGLLPPMQPAFARYRAYLEATGHADKLSA